MACVTFLGSIPMCAYQGCQKYSHAQMRANGGVEVVQCLQNRGQTTKTADLVSVRGSPRHDTIAYTRHLQITPTDNTMISKTL